MSASLPLLLLLFAFGSCLAQSSCPGAVTSSCPLAPYENELVLQNQVFCPSANTASGLEVTGTDCDSLSYCCSAFDNFSTAPPSFSVVGVAAQLDSGDADSVVIAAGQTARLEFSSLACVVRVTLSTGGAPTQGSARITLYYAAATGLAPSVVDAPLATDGTDSVATVDECRVVAIGFQAPTDAALTLSAISICLLGSQLDNCGVCGGDGATCLGDGEASSSVVVVGSGGTQVLQEACVFEAPNPIVPFVYCHRQSGGRCCTVWGYESDNPYPILATAGSDDNYFVPSPTVRGQPSVFLPGGELAAFETAWNCSAGIHIHLKWQLETLTTGDTTGLGDEQGDWPVGVQVHRLFKQGCPSGLCPL